MADSQKFNVSEALEALRRAVEVLKANPDYLNMEELSFFKEYVESFGGSIPKPSSTDTKPCEDKIPEAKTTCDESQECKDKIPEMPCAWIIDDSDEDEDDDPILPDPDVVAEEEGDVDPLPEMGDPAKDPWEQDFEAAADIKCEALQAFNAGNFELALSLFTRLILLSPTAGAYANRGNCFIRMRKPVAAIRDATQALALNPDSGKALKVRGLGNAMLGRWEEAARDLGQGQAIDYDEDTYVQQKRVARRLEELIAHDRRARAKAALREKLRSTNLREQRQRSCAA